MTTIRIDQPELRALLSELAVFFAARDIEAYATGGFLRDAILQRAIHDIDLTISGDPLVAGPVLAEAISGAYFPLREERGQARIHLPGRGLHIDLMPFRAPDIESDLRARDYTVDAMAAPLADVARGEFVLMDPTGGSADLDARIVRMTVEQAFVDDSLRLLRGPRIATELAFEIEAETAAAIRSHAAAITASAAERQRDELMRIFATDNACAGMRLLDNLGLFAFVLPEMEITRGVEQPKEHQHDVLGHSFAALEALDWLMADGPPATSPGKELWNEIWPNIEFSDGLREYFAAELSQGVPRVALLKLCGLLHDIGKPETKSFQDDGRMRFFGHSDKGARIAERLMRRLRFSSREVSIVARMIEAHLRPLQMAQNGAPTRRAVYKFFRDTGEAGIDTLFLSLADHIGTVGARLNWEHIRGHVALISYTLHMRFEVEGVVSPPKMLDGDDLMAEFGLEPGPLVGELLEAVREGQAAGEVASRDDGLTLVRARLAELRAAAPQ